MRPAGRNGTEICGAINLDDASLRLREELVRAPNVFLFRHRGNIGDELILAGTRRFLSAIPYQEVGVWNLGDATGHTALIVGSGGWCVPFHHQLPEALSQIESRFEKVIILPSSFDLREPIVQKALQKTKALVFARELPSFEQIRNTCNATISHDFAFHFDYTPYMHKGNGHLSAFREDVDSVSGKVPEGNLDISRQCFGLDHWLWMIARHDSVATDRAHVMVAGACLGKKVMYRANNYHKVFAIAEYSLSEFENVSSL